MIAFHKRSHAAMLTVLWLCLSAALALGDEPTAAIRKARITGGIVAQIGSDSLELKALGDRFHVRLLLPDDESVAGAQRSIERAGLSGRFTASVFDGRRLPFADRVLNAVVLAEDGMVGEAEAMRALAPGGLLITPAGATAAPVPDTIDRWTHYLYDGSGNAVSKDREVAPPRSFRWRAAPRFLRSHNYGASFTGLVTDNGRVFHFVDEGTPLFDKGGTTPRWALVARDAFNGAILWRAPLHGYGQPYFEDVTEQAVPDYIWRSPLSLNRRMVVQGDTLYAALHYRAGPLSILDAATGEVLQSVDLGGIVDEIVADGDLVVCRVRTEIPMPKNDLATYQKTYRELRKKGLDHHAARRELNALLFDTFRQQPPERVVAVDGSDGSILWQKGGPHVGTQTLALSDGRVLFHNYERLVCLDARTGEPRWEHDSPANQRSGIGARNLLGHLMVADGRVLWSSSSTGGGVCLDLEDGRVMWEDSRMGTRGGFGAPTGLRVIDGVIYGDFLRGSPPRLSDGQPVDGPNVGKLLSRGHHVRCMMGKATERYLLLNQRGAEYVDLQGDDHMACDWVRGACSYGLMPANGLTYVTPDPCSCYAGARIVGFMGLAPATPQALSSAPAPTAPSRLTKGPAYGRILEHPATTHAQAWNTYRADAQRTARAASPVSSALQLAWSRDLGGGLTQATLADASAYIVRKDRYELVCLDVTNGESHWSRAFPAALDGPPTIVGDALFIGCRDGSVTALRASDGALAWRFLAAPVDALTLCEDRLESIWPVHSSVLYHQGRIYCAAGRNSYLDGGIHLYALDPATGAVRGHSVLEGPWPDKESLLAGVEKGDALFKMKESEEKRRLMETVNRQWATGYHVEGGVADVLVTDGTDIYMGQSKHDPQLAPVPLQRAWHTGYTPMGGLHILANFGIIEDFMFHRHAMMYDDAWPSYGTGPGFGARTGTLVAVGRDRAYAAQHFEGAGYATHRPGAGNRIVADSLDTENLPGELVDDEIKQRLGVYGTQKSILRTDAPLWQSPTPIIVRAMLAAPNGQGGELVYVAGIVEGKTVEDWDQSTRFIGPGKLQVFDGADGALLGEYDLPACPVFDGMSSADGRVLVALVDGRVVCLQKPE